MKVREFIAQEVSRQLFAINKAELRDYIKYEMSFTTLSATPDAMFSRMVNNLNGVSRKIFDSVWKELIEENMIYETSAPGVFKYRRELKQ